MKLFILLGPTREVVVEFTVADSNGPSREPTLHEMTDAIRRLNQSVSINDISRSSVTTTSRLDDIQY